MSEIISFKNYRLLPVWQASDADLRKAAIDFWLRSGILPDRATAEKRARQLVYIIDNHHDIVGVSSAFAANAPHFNHELYYFYRMFVQPPDRIYGLAHFTALKSAQYLQQTNTTGGPLGVLIAAENPKLTSHRLMERLFGNHGWEYLGLNRVQQPTWRYLFRKQ